MRGQSVSAARAGVAGGERGLQHVRAVAAQRFGARQRIEAAADQQLIPARTILLGDRYGGAVRPGARAVARRVDLHQGQEAEHFGILGHQPGQYAAESISYVEQRIASRTVSLKRHRRPGFLLRVAAQVC